MVHAMFSSSKSKSKATKITPPVIRQHDVGGRAIALTIRQSRSATRLTLSIAPGGKALKLTVPTGLANREVEAFLDRHHGWLMTRLARFPRAPIIADGYPIHIRGVAHTIEQTGKLRGLTGATMIDGQAILKVSGEEAHLKRRIRDYLKQEARRDLEALVERHAATIERKVASVSMKDTKSRWGSCSQGGNLSFSWRLVMAPPFVIDYLAAHEVAHLVEMNHGKNFWAICLTLCPEMDEAKKWLKRNGTMLHAIDF